MAHIIAIGNNKGGARKSTTCVRLAEALARKGRRVIVGDGDPQANATRRLAVDPGDGPTINDVVYDATKGAAAHALYPCGWDAPWAKNIRVLPGHADLENRVGEAGASMGAHLRLAKALHGVGDPDEIVLLDCPPSLGHLTQLAHAAARWALCTTEPEHDSVKGAITYRDFVAQAAEDLGSPLTWMGVIISGYDQRTAGHQGQVAGCRQIFSDTVWSPHVPRRSALADADEYARPLGDSHRDRELQTIFDLHAAHLLELIS